MVVVYLETEDEKADGRPCCLLVIDGIAERDGIECNTPGPGTSGIPSTFDPVHFCFRSRVSVSTEAIMTERGRSSDLLSS